MKPRKLTARDVLFIESQTRAGARLSDIAYYVYGVTEERVRNWLRAWRSAPVTAGDRFGDFTVIEANESGAVLEHPLYKPAKIHAQSKYHRELLAHLPSLLEEDTE